MPKKIKKKSIKATEKSQKENSEVLAQSTSSKMATVKSTMSMKKFASSGSFILKPMYDHYNGGLVKIYKHYYRDGNGTYKTHDGQTYVGKWQLDRLTNKEEATITFKDGCRYVGPISDMKYHGQGSLYFLDNYHMEAKFSKNFPEVKSHIVLEDPNEEVWAGKATKDCAILKHMSTFYYNIPPGLGQPGFLYENKVESQLAELKRNKTLYEGVGAEILNENITQNKAEPLKEESSTELANLLYEIGNN